MRTPPARTDAPIANASDPTRAACSSYKHRRQEPLAADVQQSATGTSDLFALVWSLVVVPLLVGGYMEAELQVKALGSATGRWHGAWLLGLAVTDSLVVDIIVTFGLRGLPSDSFWIVWPIMALIVLTAALFAAVLGRLAAPVETFLTVNFYGLVLLSISLAAATLWRYLASHRELLDPKLTDADIRSITVITKPNMGCYVAIVALAFLVPTVAAFGYLVISLFALFRQRDDSVATGGSSSSSAR